MVFHVFVISVFPEGVGFFRFMSSTSAPAGGWAARCGEDEGEVHDARVDLDYLYNL